MGSTALMWAAERGHTETVRLLLDRTENVDLTNLVANILHCAACELHALATAGNVVCLQAFCVRA